MQPMLKPVLNKLNSGKVTSTGVSAKVAAYTDGGYCK